MTTNVTLKKDNEKYVITTSRELKTWIRVRDIFLTCIVWALYLYLMRDFFRFSWQMYHWVLNGLPDNQTRPDFRIVSTIIGYLESIFLMGSAYIGWAIYNLLRFRGRQRRKSPIPVTPDDLSLFYNFATEDIEKWQAETNMTMFHDENGFLVAVRDNADPSLPTTMPTPTTMPKPM